MAGMALLALLANAFLLPRTAFGRALARPGEPRWNGLLSYPAAVAAAYALLPPEAAAGAWAAMALGDPAAAFAGGRAGGRGRLPWNPRKTLAGSAAFLLSAWAGIALVVAAAFPAPGGIPRGALLGDPAALGILALWALCGAAAGALAESLDLPLDDNLPAALASGGVLALLAGA
jgi:dolichol kinase